MSSIPDRSGRLFLLSALIHGLDHRDVSGWTTRSDLDWPGLELERYAGSNQLQRVEHVGVALVSPITKAGTVSVRNLILGSQTLNSIKLASK